MAHLQRQGAEGVCDHLSLALAENPVLQQGSLRGRRGGRGGTAVHLMRD